MVEQMVFKVLYGLPQIVMLGSGRDLDVFAHFRVFLRCLPETDEGARGIRQEPGRRGA
jgi:hypothetical protein